MSSMNKVFLMGRLGRDPEIRTTAGGIEVANMSLATDESYKDKSGNKQKKTQWHRLTSWIAIEFIRDYLHKGDCILIEGKIEYREYSDKDGNKKSSTEVNVTNIKPVITASIDSQSTQQPAPQKTSNKPAGNNTTRKVMATAEVDEDIPF
jgi:single-strand DNA-binding protein